MSSIEEDMAALEAEIAELQAERRAATTAEERRSLLAAITAKENGLTALRTQQTELMKLSGNSTDCDLKNTALFHFWN